jgi:hypothetical protein
VVRAREMKLPALSLLLALLASPAVAETCAPAKLMKIVTRSVGPDVTPGSFRAAPVTLYRQGSRFLRNEEPADPAGGMHVLAIVASPDVWIVNRLDRTGRHMLDPGPTYEAKAPIVAGQGVPQAFTELEFGCEARFARGRAREAGVRDVAGRPARIHALQEGDRRLEILLYETGTPAEVAYFQGTTAVLTIVYDAYEVALPDNPGLFAKPEGYAISEAPSR